VLVSLNELRKKSVDEILQKAYSGVYNNLTVDGLGVPSQPAEIFREGTQEQVPVIIGSTDNEETAFARRRSSVCIWLRPMPKCAQCILKLQADDTAQMCSTTLLGAVHGADVKYLSGGFQKATRVKWTKTTTNSAPC
jgi:hypothetical protein